MNASLAGTPIHARAGALLGASWTFPTGPAAALDLPARVRRSIEAEQARNEIVVGCVRVAAIVMFGVLYAAKLEKHTKAKSVRALTTRTAYDLATTQGYRPNDAPETRSACRVAGLPEPVDLVVLAS